MLRIRPFAALRPQPNHAARVASVPYDVVSTDEARALAAGNPLSFLHVIRPEIDLPSGTDAHDDRVYAKAREALDALIAQGALVREDAPKVYLYRLVMDHRPQIGVVCSSHIDDYRNDVIRKHEKTRRDKEDDRTRHVLTLEANAGPVFLTYRNHEAIDRLVERDTNSRPLFHFDAPDGVTHTVWAVDDPSDYVAAFAQIPCAYVADGHHRAASAARAGDELRANKPGHTDDEPFNWFLTVLFPASQLRILPYNRVVRDLGGRSADEVLDQLRGLGTVTPTMDPIPDRPGVFCVLLGDRGWHRLELDPASIDTRDPVASLDVELLQTRVLEPVFGIGDPRTDERIGFVGGIRGSGELERLVREGGAAAAVSLYPTSIEQLLDVADAGRMMPPKSTWFEPKLRSGLLVHTLR